MFVWMSVRRWRLGHGEQLRPDWPAGVPWLISCFWHRMRWAGLPCRTYSAKQGLHPWTCSIELILGSTKQHAHLPWIPSPEPLYTRLRPYTSYFRPLPNEEAGKGPKWPQIMGRCLEPMTLVKPRRQGDRSRFRALPLHGALSGPPASR